MNKRTYLLGLKSRMLVAVFSLLGTFTELRHHCTFKLGYCDEKNGVNVTQKVGKEVRFFLPIIWYICSWSSAVNLTCGAFRFIGLHPAKYW